MKKTERKRLAQALLDRQPLDVLFNAQDLVTLNTLTGWNACAAKRVFNKHHSKDARCVAISHGGEFEVWSWVKAIAGYRYSANVTRAMRHAIQPQMAEYRASAEPICAACGTDKLLSVDHKTKSFTKLAANFRTEFSKLDYELSNDNDGSGWRLKHQQTDSAWREYHKKLADYQILCRSCNSAKGAWYDT
jgi:5-methylcytosine-specific restriction endonuclease McrA